MKPRRIRHRPAPPGPGPGPTAGSRAAGPLRPDPGGHIRLQFADPDDLAAAARALGEATRDDDALTLDISSDGDVTSLRALLDRLGDASIEVAGLSIHTPDLDDVFLALTGQPDKDKEPTR